MNKFGLFIMRNRLNAVLLTLVFAAVPLLNWLAMVIMALVTLRKGAQEGLLLVGVALIPAVGYSLFGQWMMLPYTVLTIGTLWLSAVVLRKTQAWSAVLLVGVLIALVIITAWSLYLGDVASWWQQQMTAYMQQAGREMALDTQQQVSLLQKIAPYGLGLQISILWLVNLAWLACARLWQALLFNPGQLRPELYNIRLPQWAVLVFGLLSGVAWLTQMGVLLNVLPVVLLCLVLAGLSLTHFVLSRQNRGWIWLLMMYTALFFLLPYMLLALMVVAICDSIMNVRRRYSATV